MNTTKKLMTLMLAVLLMGVAWLLRHRTSKRNRRW